MKGEERKVFMDASVVMMGNGMKENECQQDERTVLISLFCKMMTTFAVQPECRGSYWKGRGVCSNSSLGFCRPSPDSENRDVWM